MSEGLNRVILLGNLGDQPELRMTNGGTPVLSIRMATSESYLDKQKQKQERTEWHRVTVWNRRAEGLGKILKKGDRILVEGRIQTSSYDDKDGNRRYSTEIVATNVVLSGGGNSGGGGGGSSPRTGGGGFDDADYGGKPDDDDIPFLTCDPVSIGSRNIDRI